MRKTFALMLTVLLMRASAVAKDLREVVMKTTPEMKSEKVEKKVKNHLWLTAGVKKIRTDLSNQLVIVTYDADKTSEKSILSSMKKAGFEAKVVSNKAGEPKDSKKVPVDATSGASQQKK